MDDTLTPERYELLCELVDGAASLPENERTDFLLKRCGKDAILLSKARQMLASREKLARGQFMDGTAPVSAKSIAMSNEEEMIGQQLGHYKIERRIDAGGMGTVYLAIRVDDYQEAVAIKIIRTGLNDGDVIQRFRTERQVLAGLRHPNIATLLDGGTTADGRPYFVMEYIQGESITAFCSRHQLVVTQRLHLLSLAAAGVQHAHQRAVLHRDLKPSNILVTTKGAVKLVDFGIAKLIQPEAFGQQPLQTQPYERALTPQYASPEQVRGETPLMASDVYALGMVLYELLTGEKPYNLSGLSWGQTEKRICEEIPLPPSEMVRRRRDHAPQDKSRPTTSPRELQRKLRGDLDNIVLMALRKEPERRYVSAEQLIADINRYLQGLPVAARKDTWWYRTRKFINRNRLTVSAATLLLLSLMAGIIGTSIGLGRATVAERKATKRFDEIRNLATVSVFDIHDRIAELPGSTPVREFVVTKGVEYLDNLARDAGDEQPDLLYDLSLAYLRAGDAAGNPYQSSLGKLELARSAYRKAEQLADRAVALAPDNAEYVEALIAARASLADVVGATENIDEAFQKQVELTQLVSIYSDRFLESATWQSNQLASILRLATYESLRGNWHEAMKLNKDSIALARKISQQWPDRPDSNRLLYRAYNAAGLTQSNMGEKVAALVNLQSAIEVVDAMHKRDTAKKRDLFGRAAMELLVADLQRGLGQFSQATTAYRTSIKVYGQLADEDPQDFRAQVSLAEGECGLALLVAASQPDESLKLAQQAQQRLKPFVAEGHGGLAVTACIAYQRIGDCLAALHKPDAAETAYSQAVTLADKCRERDRRNVYYTQHAAQARRELARFYRGAGKQDEGLKLLRQSNDWLDSQERKHGQDSWFLDERAMQYGLVADLYATSERWDEAINSARQALAAAETLASRDRSNFAWQSNMARNLDRLALLHYARSEQNGANRAGDLLQAAQYGQREAKRWDDVVERKIVPQEQIQAAQELRAECVELLRRITNTQPHK